MLERKRKEVWKQRKITGTKERRKNAEKYI